LRPILGGLIWSYFAPLAIGAASASPKRRLVFISGVG
jgi:hypothetical protein